MRKPIFPDLVVYGFEKAPKCGERGSIFGFWGFLRRFWADRQRLQPVWRLVGCLLDSTDRCFSE